MPDVNSALMSTRERLSEHAARLFAEHGYHGTSIGDIASALGIQKSSVYAHIEGKEYLLVELALAGAEAFHGALDDLPPTDDPVTRLKLAFGAHLGVVARQLDVSTVWLLEWRYLSGAARDQFLSERHRYEQRVAALFQEAVASGELRADLDVEHATLAFFSLGNWAYTWLSPRSDVEQLAGAFWELLYSGIAPR